MKRVYLVRHGQTVGNLGKFFQFPETELSEAGHAGGKAVAQRFKHVAVDLLVASHFTRAQQTAEYIAQVVDVPVVTVEAFHEQYAALAVRGLPYASEEGVAYKCEHQKHFFETYWRPEGAENYFDVLKRIETCTTFLETSAESNIVVVSHSNFIKLLSAYLVLNAETDVTTHKKVADGLRKMSNVGISEFTYTGARWGLQHWNDYAHFAE